jgi:predicted nucleic acid-binding protein
MADVLLDSTVVIDLSRRRPEVVAYVGVRPGRDFLLHHVTAAEVLSGAKSKADLRSLDDLLERFAPAAPTREDFDHCLAFVRRLNLSHGIGWPDCLIAATALRLGVTVVTLNDKHFRAIRGLKVLRPY